MSNLSFTSIWQKRYTSPEKEASITTIPSLFSEQMCFSRWMKGNLFIAGTICLPWLFMQLFIWIWTWEFKQILTAHRRVILEIIINVILFSPHYCFWTNHAQLNDQSELGQGNCQELSGISLAAAMVGSFWGHVLFPSVALSQVKRRRVITASPSQGAAMICGEISTSELGK